MLPPLAAADPMSDAKSKGLVGERWDGYLGLVTEEVPISVHELVRHSNTGRRLAYEDLALKHRVPMVIVEERAGQLRIDRAKRGSYVMIRDGTWTRK